MEVSRSPRCEVRYWYSIICALVQHELAHERQFKIPGVGLLYPDQVHNKRFFDYQTQSWQIYDTWIKVKVSLDNELKARYREKYPYRPNPISDEEMAAIKNRQAQDRKRYYDNKAKKAAEAAAITDISVDDLC